MRNRSALPQRLALHLIGLACVILAGGFLAAALVRYSPGFDSIPEDLVHISPAALQALQQERARENSLPRFYARYLANALHGDLGISESLRRPVSELIRDRAPVTARLILLGTAGGWLLGGFLAWLSVWARRPALEALALAAGGLLLAIPPAVMALAFFFSEAPLALALSLALVPGVFGSMRALLEDCYACPAILAAGSRGVGGGFFLKVYVLRAG
ncbi:MAG: hypothetical protein M3N93_05610, partial [Acidobacteriota bacterium]|nr:hypothetical protein [Acidobacteriota bacterium]